MLRKCEGCGRFFGAEGDEKRCTSCSLNVDRSLNLTSVEDIQFHTARNLVYENPEIHPEKLVELMIEQGIPITYKEIMAYVKEGRLTLVNGTSGIHCEECGTKILSGRFCPRCTRKKEQQMQGNYKPKNENSQEQNKKKVGMHTAPSKDK